MRIRKHAKISPLLYATASLDPGTLPQAHICQLNQSPWDVMNFSPPPPSPPPSQVDGNYIFAGKGTSSRDSIAVVKREWMNELNKATKWEHSGGSVSGGAASNETEQEVGTSPKDSPIILCCKTDGKSWQCRREAAKGNSLCEHHLIMVRSYGNNHAHSAAKNSAKSTAEARGLPRIKKRAAQSLSNPYVFYYYSGFGPRWGKKRGEFSKNSNEELHMIPKDDLEEDKETSSSCHIEREGIEGLDDDDSDYDDDEDVKKKRTRKPIKARSLKSLM